MNFELIWFCFRLQVTSISFNYQNHFFNAFVKYTTFNFSDYLAATGGVIGLIAGMSVISLIEFVYHFLVFLLSYWPKKKFFIKVWPIENIHPENFISSLNQEHLIFQFSKHLLNFINESSIHGLTYTTNKNENFFGRFFWIGVVTLSSITCGFLIVDNFKHAELNPIAIGIDSVMVKANEVIRKSQFKVLCIITNFCAD
jgi:Amiloride-sensitive sodium channel